MTRCTAPRRFFRTATGLLAATAVLATGACGSDGGPAAAPAPTPTVTAVPVSSSTLPTVERGAFPVAFRHTWGVTRIEEEPERVVVLGMREQDTMTSLGVMPLTVRNFFGAEHPWTSFPWVPEAVKATDFIELYLPLREPRNGKTTAVEDGPVGDNEWAQASNTPIRKEVFDSAAITALNPDLIVAMFAGLTLEDYQALSAIAPTVTMVSSDSKDYHSSWQEEARALGAILGRPDAAEQMVRNTAQLFIEAKREHPELEGASIALAAPGPAGEIRIINPYAPMSRFFTALGMEFPGRIKSATSYSGVSRKMYYIETSTGSGLSFIDNVDAVVWIVGHDGGEAMERLKSTSAYQNMRAVRSGNVIELGPDLAEALYYSSVTSLPWALERLVPMLTDVLGEKAARDKEREREAERAAEEAGELNIDFKPSEDPAPNPYQDLLEGENLDSPAEESSPGPDTTESDSGEPAGATPAP